MFKTLALAATMALAALPAAHAAVTTNLLTTNLLTTNLLTTNLLTTNLLTTNGLATTRGNGRVVGIELPVPQ